MQNQIHSHSAKTILVIDDDDSIREVVTMLLNSEGYEVVTAGNGQEGLDRLNESTPSLILLDSMMPIMDGREFKRNLDRRPNFKNIPVFSFSAGTEGSPDVGSVAEVIQKPFQVDHFLNTIGRYLQ